MFLVCQHKARAAQRGKHSASVVNESAQYISRTAVDELEMECAGKSLALCGCGSGFRKSRARDPEIYCFSEEAEALLELALRLSSTVRVAVIESLTALAERKGLVSTLIVLRPSV